MLVIKNGRYINPATREDTETDILIDRGVVKLMNMGLTYANADEIDAKGMIIAPGLVDTHAHFREPGFEYKETIRTGADAAKRGGYTTVVLMANTYPPVDNVSTLKYILEEGRWTNININSVACVTEGMKGEKVVDMFTLREAGAVAFSDDGFTITDEKILKKAMRDAAAFERPICLHEENPRYVKTAGINKGYASETLGVKGACRKAEITQIKRDLDLALDTGATVVIQHISTKEGVDLVRQAKKYNPLIYAEAAPHHFSLTEETLIEKGANAKVNPPLRTEDDRLAIIEGLQDGTIEIIATDHAPHTAACKNGRLSVVDSGMIGLETALSLGIKELVYPGYLTINELIEKMSTNPAKIYNLDAGNSGKGRRADFVIFDMFDSWKVENFASFSRNSPFIGETLPGIVHYTICKGQVVYSRE